MILKIANYSNSKTNDEEILIYKGQQLQVKIEQSFGRPPSVIISCANGIIVDFETTSANARRCLEDIEKALVYDKITNPEVFL